MYSESEKDTALQRLRLQAEIGGWFNELSTVPVRIGDLYKVFELLADQQGGDNACKPSDVVRDHFKWLQQRCKDLKKDLDEHKASRSGWWYDSDPYGDNLQSRLDECVRIKVSTEKYMKKLRHEGK